MPKPSRVGLIVDGPGDHASFSKRFVNLGVRILKTDGPRGHTVPLEVIVNQARKQISILHAFGCRAVVLLFDFERRHHAHSTAITSCDEHAASCGFPIPVKVCSPNRMIENWYLADVKGISSRRALIRSGQVQKPYEGTHGKQQLKRILLPSITYNEVTHGPQLFMAVRFTVARANSTSLKHFLETLEGLGVTVT
jgi:hypothetical protein